MRYLAFNPITIWYIGLLINHQDKVILTKAAEIVTRTILTVLYITTISQRLYNRSQIGPAQNCRYDQC